MGFFLFSLMCLPPDPALVGDSWRAMWLERLQKIPLFQENWFRHQRRDAYWKHGSVCEDYAAIQCPVYAVGRAIANRLMFARDERALLAVLVRKKPRRVAFSNVDRLRPFIVG